MKASKKLHRVRTGRMVVFTITFLAAIATFKPKNSSGIPVQATSQVQQPPSSGGLAEPGYQADFTPVIANGSHTVSWGKGYLVSSGTREPVALYDKTGKWLFETRLTFENAIKVYVQDATPTNSGAAVVAASAAKADGTSADLIVEAGKDGIRRVIRTSPFYPEKICATNEGIVWAFGKELTANRAAEPRVHYPILREYSFEKGELRSVLDRATFISPTGVPITGAHNDVYLQCTPGKIVVVSGPTKELVEYDLSSSKLSRYPIAGLPDGFYMTGAAVTESGEVYVSTFRPGQNALTGMVRLQVNSSGTADLVFLAPDVPSAGKPFMLLGSDGEDLVYSRGLRAPTLFWSRAGAKGVGR